ncbi:MAG: FAD-binding oxidoreductase [Sinobacteraceae bacterium]|nr:FAD-binding oxidoreductase [Nevskiaceae bacterium]
MAAETVRSATSGIAHGMGRSYGDVGLNPNGLLWKTTGLDRFISFDEHTGVLTCEAGVLLRDIQTLTMPRGWALPVTPGTQLVTVGGAIANDVHGKNHHAFGSFGDHVRRLTLIRTGGEVVECGPQLRPDWFAATVGGLGLTGLIVDADLQLRPVTGPWLTSETTPYFSLEDFFELSDEAESDWEHTVSWIDCTHPGRPRGIFVRARPAEEQRRGEPAASKLVMPFVPPVSLVNRLSLPLANAAIFRRGAWRSGRSIVHYRRFFYPLDHILEWNRMYGPKGFYQYQAAIPRRAGLEAIRAMLAEIRRSGQGSFLTVLKTFGNREAVGLLSFALHGVTLAIDFANRGPATLDLFAKLDDIVRETGGRIYPAKDARMPRELFEVGYPKLAQFLPYRDPGMSSAMSRRLMGH